MSVPSVPTLSDRGWVSQPEEMVDFLLSDFFLSDAIQSYLYADSISNVQVIVQQNTDSVPNLCAALGVALERYMSKYFDSAMATITQVSKDPTQPNALSLNIYTEIQYNGTTYSVGGLLSMINSRFQFVATANNTGVASA